MNKEQLFEQIKLKRSFLCVGLDTDILKIPRFLNETSDPIFAFNKEIIDATQDLCVAYKPNLAFYESLGVAGWISLEKNGALHSREISGAIHHCRCQTRRYWEYFEFVCACIFRSHGF